MLCDVKKAFTPTAGEAWELSVRRPSTFGDPPVKPATDHDEHPTTGDAAYRPRPRGLHSGGCNVGFCDGHAKWLVTDAFFYGQNPTNKFFDLQ